MACVVLGRGDAIARFLAKDGKSHARMQNELILKAFRLIAIMQDEIIVKAFRLVACAIVQGEMILKAFRLNP
jgi:hypothetical protein